MHCHTAVESPAESAPTQRSLRQAFNVAVLRGGKFWERGRLVYNAVLAYFFTRLPESRQLLTIDSGITFGILVIGANIVYSTAYLPEILLQTTMPLHFARPVRVIVFLAGTIFACFVAGFALDSLLLTVAD